MYVADHAATALAEGRGHADLARVREMGWRALVAATEQGFRDVVEVLRHREH